MRHKLRNCFQVILLTGLVCAMPAIATAADSLGLNFGATDPDAATSSLNPGDVAGVVPAANWNNLEGATGSAPSGLVYDSNGVAAASGVSVSWSSPNTWRSGGNNAFPAGPDHVLTSGYLDTGNTSANGISITVSDIDAALRTPAYDVYVYFVSDSAADRGGGYTIDDGIGPRTLFGSTMASPSAFVEDPGTDTDNSLDGTHLVFRGLTGSSFTLTSDTTLTDPNGFRAPINGLQIVVVPEPTGATLAIGGATLLASLLRRRRTR